MRAPDFRVLWMLPAGSIVETTHWRTHYSAVWLRRPRIRTRAYWRDIGYWCGGPATALRNVAGAAWSAKRAQFTLESAGGLTMRPIVPFDPWDTCPDPRGLRAVAREWLPPGDLAPGPWFTLSVIDRARLGGVIVEAISDFPGASRDRLASIVNVVINAQYLKLEDLAGFGDVESQNYARQFTTGDAEERDEWRRLTAHVQELHGGGLFLAECVDRLRAAGDALTTLRARRDALNATIERLEGRLAKGRRPASREKATA